ncbi:hypothetical protein [Winogradskyella algicola]|uniref:hypothetical protein n=1 Tax=Winogradskyella algicola TaxID=2575815 RepID=UPI0011086BD5|nr:hypothetical protein [Winogradskyella algicola]
MKTKTLLALIFICQFVFSQTKNEKEERITKSEFPEVAIEVIKSLPDDCKRLKFYKETDGEKQSFEVKFKYKKKRCSLEFTKDGVIEDLEVLTKFKTINEEKKSKIKDYFRSNFTKHKFIKAQKQYVYQKELDPVIFIKNILKNTTTEAPNFEIIAEVKTDKKRDIREFTFNASGEFVNFRIINPTSYEHVLY